MVHNHARGLPRASASSTASAHSPQRTPRRSIGSTRFANARLPQRPHARALSRSKPSTPVAPAGGTSRESRRRTMMSTHTSTHSLQIKTVGPAMSVRSFDGVLSQNEHRGSTDRSSRLTVRRAVCSRFRQLNIVESVILSRPATQLRAALIIPRSLSRSSAHRVMHSSVVR